MNPIPDSCLLHCIALLPGAVEPHRFLTPLRRRRPNVRTEQTAWKTATLPRACAFGPLLEGEWSWQVVIDLGPLPAGAWKASFGEGAPPPHAAHAFVFLLSAPKAASGLDRVRTTLDLTWAFLEAGATALLFPTGGAVNERAALAAVDPRRLDADGASAMLISIAAMGSGADGRFWVRTRGMSQFGQPDLCVALPGAPDHHPQELEAAQLLFGSVAPYVISNDRPIGEGETVEIGARTWMAGSAADLRGAPATLGAVQAFRRAEKRRPASVPART